MNILVLGSGGRESAFIKKIIESPQTEALYAAPGNAGTALWAENIPLDIENFASIKDFAIKKQIGMILVGPELPLVKGIHDYFLADSTMRDIKIIGPCKSGARLEGSKSFAKDFMKRAGIPTAAYQSFKSDQIESARVFLRTLKPPYVLKADGLASGKGVLIAENLQQAEEALEEMLLQKKFGSASETLVIEEFLQGIEFSVFVLTDGKNYKILPSAKDYKKIGEKDQGLNTGGMGAVSPVPFVEDALMRKVEEKIIIPTLSQLQKEKIPYSGFLFIGLMKVGDEPYVIEYNVRMGDPETEVVLPRIESDFVELLSSVAPKKLDEIKLKIKSEFAVCVMLASGGYPEKYKTNYPIEIGADIAAETYLFHAGSFVDELGTMRTNAGRVIAVTTLDPDLRTAIKKTYTQVDKVKFKDRYFRGDIGKDLLCI